MAVHKLVLDDFLEEASYTLIAIHCTIEDFRLAYLLNKHLGINLTRKTSDLDFKKDKSAYSIFEWKDDKHLTTWSLVSNICKMEETLPQVSQQSLFDTVQPVTKTFNLVPEYKRVNYFLKIDNEYNTSKEAYILNSILNVSQIATAYSVDVNQLKSKDHLIFS